MAGNEINATLSLVKTKKDEVVRLDFPVRRCRRFCGYRQKELAELLEISELTYRNKEKGRVPFKGYETGRIVKLFYEDGIYLDIVDIFSSDLETKGDGWRVGIVDISSVQIILPSDLDQSLRRYFYQVAKGAVDQVRIETSLSKEISRLGEACEYLSCSKSTLRKFINQRSLKMSITGDYQFTRKEELARFIKEYEI